MIRIGLGVDVHAFAPARALVIGGVTIPHELGLDGHSDADVLSHAIADALLGAAGLGDIGRHFPASDPRWEGCPSLEFLREVRRMLAVAGWRPGNLDSVIIAQEPRMEPYLPAMHRAVAGALEMAVTDVSIKATTTDKLGAVGRGEGIAAQAVVLIGSTADPSEVG
jgi:2-C-methyl-D-erythritol 2,4-cyclodiphosphate synthase